MTQRMGVKAIKLDSQHVRKFQRALLHLNQIVASSEIRDEHSRPGQS